MSGKQKIAVLVMVALIVGGSLASAGDWQKLGSKAIAFKDKPVDITLTAKDVPAAEIKLKVSGTWVRFTSVTLNFSDGSSQTIADQIDVEPGLTSDPIAVDGGPKAIASIDLSCESASSARGGRATIAVLGS
jgi:hypothetical protein